MPIPEVAHDGFLPGGIFDATLDEVEETFGRFGSSDRRVRLFENLGRYIRELNMWRNAEEILLDGSFISGAEEPNDIDMIVVYREGFDFGSPVRPAEYNLLSRRRVKKQYGSHVFLATANSPEREAAVQLFSNDPRIGKEGKGLVRIRL